MEKQSPIGDAVLAARSVRDWLAQFHKSDRLAAVSLLCSLRFIGSSHYDELLMRLTVNLATEPRIPVALFATRELTWGARFFDGHGHAVRFAAGGEIGSEGAAAFLLTRLSRADRRFLVEPTIEQMRAAKCRRMIFVDDLIGSGTRTRIFTDAVYGNATIKSWRSYGFIDAAVVTYAATEDGERKVLNRNALVSVVSTERRPEADTNWLDEETRRSIKDVCYRYAKRGKLPKRYALGVDEIFGTLIFEHACTNVTPAILWMKSDMWQPLFPNRTIPLDMRSLFRIETPSGAILERLRRLGYRKIDERQRTASQSPALGVETAAFLGVAARFRSIKKIAQFLGITFSECEALAASACRRGLTDAAFRLTELGRAELARLAREAPHEQKKLPSNEETIYIPRQLRVT